MLEPLPPGAYTIRLGGSSTTLGFAVDVTANIIVQEVLEPSGLLLLGAVATAAGGYGWRRHPRPGTGSGVEALRG
jgi:hypothetical protein